VFEGVKRAYMLQVLYIMKVIEIIGTDPAIEILIQAAERQGEVVSKMFKKKLSVNSMKLLDIGAEVYQTFMRDTGAKINQYKRDEKSVTFLINRCPFYEVFLDVGVDCGVFLNGLCSNLTLPSIQAILKQFDERLKIEPVLTRETIEEFCLERVFIQDNV
jgi:hypothetical protein